MAWSTPHVWASGLAMSRHGKPSQVWQRMQAALRHAALTEDALAEEVSAKPAAVRQVLRRSAHLFLRLVDGRIGLKAHDDDSF